MSRIRPHFFAAAVLLTAFLLRAEENMLRNGDFRQTGKVGGAEVPLHWKPTGKAAAKIVADGGRNAVRLESGQQRIHLVQNGLRLVPGREYVFSVEYRGTPGTKGLFYIERSGHVLALEKIECSGDWRKGRILVTMPPATKKLPYAVIAVEPGGGTLDAADAKIVELAPRSGSNPLRNGDFRMTKTVGGRRVPAFWTTNNKGKFEVVEADGRNVVRFTLDPENRGNIIQWGVPLTPGKEYLLSFDYRGPVGAKAAFYIERSAKVMGIKKVQCDGEWRHGELLVTMPPATGKNPYVVIRAEPGEGELDVADLKLVELPPRSADNLLRNGDFAMTFAGGGGKKLPSLWSTVNGAVFETVPGTDGKNAVRFHPDPKSRRHFVQWGVPLVPGRDYLFSLRYRGTPGTGFIFGVERGGKRHFSQLKKDVKCLDKWQTVRVLVHMPEEVVPNVPYAVLAAEPGGDRFEIADLRIFPAEAKLRNGDFEQGDAAWTLQNAVVTEAGGRGKVVRLDGTAGKAAIRQGELLLKRGHHYELSYDARGGSDTRYTDSQNATWYRLVILADGHPYSTTANWQDSFSRWQHKSITFTANRNATAELAGELRYPGTVYFDNIKLREIDFIGVPLEIVLDAPWNYTRGAVTGARGEFTGTAFISVKAEKLRIDFAGKTYELPADKAVAFKLPMPEAEGRCEMVFAALGADGKVLAEVRDCFTVRGPAPKENSHRVDFDREHRMYLDGKPFFPIMTWRNRGPLPIEESYPRFADLGFNLIECPIANIDAADAAGLYVLPEMPAQVFRIRTPEEAERYLVEFTAKYGYLVSHPAVVGYFSVDEPTWRGDPLEPFAAGYRLLRDRFDPWRPVYINEAPRGSVDSLRPVMNACDVYGVDIYPVPSPNPHSELADKTVTSVGKYTDICRDVTRGRKPVWMCLQGFAWGTLTGTKEIYPTYAETRFMAFDAIAHGATGLVYWGLYMGRGEDPEFLAGLKKTLHEVTSVGAFLVGDTVENSVRCGDRAIRVMHKRSRESGELWIVLNESPDERSFALDGGFPAKLVETSGEALPEVRDGKLELTLPAYGVRVFRDGARPAPVPLYVPKERRPQNVYHGKDGFKRAEWVWFPGEWRVKDSEAWFEQEFALSKAPKSAELAVACDDKFRCWVNGEFVMEQMGWARACTLDVAKYLKPGRNVIRIRAADAGGPPCGLLYALSFDDGTEVFSGPETRTSRDGKNDWQAVEVLGKYGIKPWTEQISAAPYEPPKDRIEFRK